MQPPAALHQLGIRHAAVNARGLVAVAMQYEGSKRDRVPLVGLHEGEELRLLEAPEEIQRRMRHYTGAIAFDLSGELLAVSSPRGNLFTFWDAAARHADRPSDGVRRLRPQRRRGARRVPRHRRRRRGDPGRAAHRRPPGADGRGRRRHAVGQSLRAPVGSSGQSMLKTFQSMVEK